MFDKPLTFALGFVMGHILLFVLMIHKVEEIKEDRDSLECVIERQLYYNHEYRIYVNTLLNNNVEMSSYDYPKCSTGKYNKTGYQLID